MTRGRARCSRPASIAPRRWRCSDSSLSHPLAYTLSHPRKTCDTHVFRRTVLDVPTSIAIRQTPGHSSYALSTPALLHAHGKLPRCSHVRVGPTDTTEGGLGEKRLGGGRQHGESTAGRAQTSFSQTYRSGSPHRRVQLHIAWTCIYRISLYTSPQYQLPTAYNSVPP